MKFTALIHEDEDGGYWAHVRELPGCLTQGDTLEELEENLREVIELYIEGLISDHVDSLTPVEPDPPPGLAWSFELSFSGPAKGIHLHSIPESDRYPVNSKKPTRR